MLKKILFVCSGNTCRSPMAEKICNKLSKKLKINVIARSAGIVAKPNEKMNAKALKALSKNGIHFVRHNTKMFSLDMINEYDYVIAMTEKQKNYIGNFNNVYCFIDLLDNASDVIDPYSKDQNIYNETYTQLYKYIDEFLRRI